MVQIAPFSSQEEHQKYCTLCELSYEEGTIGFKIFSETESLGACLFKLVGDAAYVLGIANAAEHEDPELLKAAFATVLDFFEKAGLSSIIYPVQSGRDVDFAEDAGFDRLSDTLYSLEFDSAHACSDPDCHCHDHDDCGDSDCDCHHHH